MNQAFLGLGANIGPRLLNLRVAVERLRDAGTLEAVSSLYESDPVGGPEGQPPFYNAVCLIRTPLSPLELLSFVKSLEREMGRWEGPRWGPRPLDIDILLWGDKVIKEEDLEVPHPRLAERPFFLVPLAEIAPQAHHPLLGTTIGQLAEKVGRRGLSLVLRRGWEKG